MRSVLISSFILLGFSMAVASSKKTEGGHRTPASIEKELVDSYLGVAEGLSKARIENKVCDFDTHQGSIIDAIRSAENLEGFEIARISANMREALRGTIALAELTKQVNLYRNPSESEYQKALTNTYFEGPAFGAYGPAIRLQLQSGGILKVTTREALNEEPWIKDTESAGRWGLQVKEENNSRNVRVWFTFAKKTTTYLLERTSDFNGWILKLNRGKQKTSPRADEFLNIRFYNGFASECDA